MHWGSHGEIPEQLSYLLDAGWGGRQFATSTWLGGRHPTRNPDAGCDVTQCLLDMDEVVIWNAVPLGMARRCGQAGRESVKRGDG